MLASSPEGIDTGAQTPELISGAIMADQSAQLGVDVLNTQTTLPEAATQTRPFLPFSHNSSRIAPDPEEQNVKITDENHDNDQGDRDERGDGSGGQQGQEETGPDQLVDKLRMAKNLRRQSMKTKNAADRGMNNPMEKKGRKRGCLNSCFIC